MNGGHLQLMGLKSPALSNMPYCRGRARYLGFKSSLGLLSALFIFLALISSANAQAENEGTSAPIKKDSTHAVINDSLSRLKDVNDVFAVWFHQQRSYQKDTSAKRAHKLFVSLIPGVGYAEENGFFVTAEVIGAFYTSENKDENISSITIAPDVTQKKQLILPIVTNIWTPGNKIDFQNDIRYYIYPSITYGLGGKTTPADLDPINYQFIRFYQQVLKKLAPDLVGGIGYNLDYHYDITETPTASDVEGGKETDFERYDGGHILPTSSSSGLSLNLLYDTRRNLLNPVAGGTYMNVLIRQNLTMLGSNTNYENVQLDFRKYFQFPYGSRNILAFWNYYWFNFSGQTPYLDMPSTNWDTYSTSGRGYIQDRFRGRDEIYLEAEYRINFMKSGLIGAVVFSNMQAYSQQWPNNAITTLIPAAGAGLRIKINKLSNTNLCVDYGIGRDGGNIFLNLGEIF